MAQAEKELNIWVDGECCGVKVSPTDTLANVRAKITEEFDDEMLPEQSQDFIVLIDNTRLSRKQESNRIAWEVVNSKATLCLKAKSSQVAKRPATAMTDDASGILAKKATRDPFDTAVDEIECESEDESMSGEEAAPRNEETITPSQKSHVKYDIAVKKSCENLKITCKWLQHPDNATLFSGTRKDELVEQIEAGLRDSSAPDTIIGVLGRTGVGKSSVLNALLDEASILPTSGSRGCTAAVVELRFNKDFLDEPKQETTVYKGRVEFISLQEWHDELKSLLDDCCTEKQTIFEKAPDEKGNPEAAAAWAKINQVYGQRTMESHAGVSPQEALRLLGEDQRVAELLTGQNGQPNTILVDEGTIDAKMSKLLLGPPYDLPVKLRRMKAQWAKSFRTKINDYVYRKGSGKEAQTWPLIRKVVLYGPWSVLSTGACLVDMPGVRDANAARAKVAETYLQNCHYIWIMAPIKRAVDDGTAKELLGTQFKRSLLMDGQYCNVSFICTQTDDCETTEIMRDHEDVARMVDGRWEKMNKLKHEISSIEKQHPDTSEAETLTRELAEAKQELKKLKAQIKLPEKDDPEGKKLLHQKYQLAKSTVATKMSELRKIKCRNDEEIRKLQERALSFQKSLKAIAATVRNEYSTKCLQEDFIVGLEELIDQKPAGNLQVDGTTARSRPLPDGFQLKVHCVSANDYLKIMKLKPSQDGPPNTFSEAKGTQIIDLRNAVHDTTAQHWLSFAQSFMDKTSNLLDHAIVLSEDRESKHSAEKLSTAFFAVMETHEPKLSSIVSNFVQKAQWKVDTVLQPPMKAGAKKSTSVAKATVNSWASGNDRANGKGLRFQTYNAVVRRSGEYTSKRWGLIDFNQKLFDPMEEEFSAAWQDTMDRAMIGYLDESEDSANELLSALSRALTGAFAEIGMTPSELKSLTDTAKMSCQTAIRTSFNDMRNKLKKSQRGLSRSLKPRVCKGMRPGYDAAFGVPRGQGTFQRMQVALGEHAEKEVQNMFEAAANHGLQAVFDVVQNLSTMIGALGRDIRKRFRDVYSVCWDQQHLADPAMREKVQLRRLDLLVELKLLRKTQDKTMEILGVQHKAAPFEESNTKMQGVTLAEGEDVTAASSGLHTIMAQEPYPLSAVSNNGAMQKASPSLADFASI